MQNFSLGSPQEHTDTAAKSWVFLLSTLDNRLGIDIQEEAVISPLPPTRLVSQCEPDIWKETRTSSMPPMDNPVAAIDVKVNVFLPEGYINCSI